MNGTGNGRYEKPTPIRDGFGHALLALGEQDSRVVALTADLSEAVRVHWFAEKFPDRFFQMGIAENDMIGTAAGLALGGRIPFATTFAVFATSLANQPVRLSVGYNRANVKIVASHGGVTVGGDGATHQGFEDIALMRMVPGMTVILPADAGEAFRATMAIAEYEGPVYMRIGRIASPVLTDPASVFRIGRADVLREGRDVALIGCGMLLGAALEAAEILAGRGVSCRVINMHTVKPLDREALTAAAEECGAVVTVEEHSILGGLGGAVAEILAETRPVPLERVGIGDTFGESGEPDEILQRYGLTPEDIVSAAERALARKGPLR